MSYIIVIMIIHFLSDFVFQSRKMGTKKSKSNLWLFYHVLTYSLITLVLWVIFVAGVVINFKILFSLFLFTFTSHFFVDFFTSRISSLFYIKAKEEKIYKQKMKFEQYFWLTIGIDQLIHNVTLLLTYNFLFL